MLARTYHHYEEIGQLSRSTYRSDSDWHDKKGPARRMSQFGGAFLKHGCLWRLQGLFSESSGLAEEPNIRCQNPNGRFLKVPASRKSRISVVRNQMSLFISPETCSTYAIITECKVMTTVQGRISNLFLFDGSDCLTCLKWSVEKSRLVRFELIKLQERHLWDSNPRGETPSA